MFFGYKMYNELGITNYKEDTIEIYINRLVKKNKKIGKYKSTYVDIHFSASICSMIRTLELIQKGYRIKDRDDAEYLKNMDLPLATYSDLMFEMINDAIKYNYSAIVTLDRKLSKYSIPNKCLEWFCFKLLCSWNNIF